MKRLAIFAIAAAFAITSCSTDATSNASGNATDAATVNATDAASATENATSTEK